MRSECFQNHLKGLSGGLRIDLHLPWVKKTLPRSQLFLTNLRLATSRETHKKVFANCRFQRAAKRSRQRRYRLTIVGPDAYLVVLSVVGHRR